MPHSEKISQWEFSISKHLSIKYTELSQNTAALLFFLFNISKSPSPTTTNRGYNTLLSFFSFHLFLVFLKPSHSDIPLQNTEINHHKETSKLPLWPHFPENTKAFKNVLIRMVRIRSKTILCLILCMNDTLENYVSGVCWLNVGSFSSSAFTET